MSEIFISYAREDAARAAQFADALEAMGYDVFWDLEIPPGTTWADYTEEKLSRAKVMIVLWSAVSVQSQWVREEARVGRDKGMLIPVMLDGASPPFGFGEVQAADFSHWNGRANDPSWTRFVDAISNRLGPPPKPARAAPPQFQQLFTPAPEPETPGVALSPIGYVKKCLRLYVNALGRARRAEYWWWVLFAFVVYLTALVFDSAIFGFNGAAGKPNMQMLSTAVWLGFAAPGVCVTIRRYHDVGLSGWIFLAVMAAIVLGVLTAISNPTLGGLLFLAGVVGNFVISVLPSRPGENVYGPNPKGQ